jgi:hypothetical protein
MLLALLPLAAAITLAACGSNDGGGDGAQPAEPAVTSVPTKGLPKPLAENRKQANQIIDGSTEARRESQRSASAS